MVFREINLRGRFLIRYDSLEISHVQKIRKSFKYEWILGPKKLLACFMSSNL